MNIPTLPDSYYLNFVKNDPITITQWRQGYVNMTAIEALARLIIGEETTFKGMNAVAKVIQNRWLSKVCIGELPLTITNGRHNQIIAGNIDSAKPWHSVIGLPNAFTPITGDGDPPSQCLNPMKEGLASWKHAVGIIGPVTWKLLFPFLKVGRGTKDEVIALQKMLAYQKHVVVQDGIFGNGTDSAVRAYQTMKGLTADGQVGDMTWESLALSTPMSGNSISFGSGGSGTSGSSTLIHPGDISSQVRQVKRRLAADGGYTGSINNIYGSDLQYTVQAFQSAQGVTVDGIIGSVTWKLLFPIVKKQSGQQNGAKAVQVLLNLNGFSVGTPDGLFGTGSETKLIAFQTAKGLTPDGMCGEATWARLCEI